MDELCGGDVEVFTCEYGVGLQFDGDDEAYIFDSRTAREIADALSTMAGYWDMEQFKAKDPKGGAKTFKLVD